MYIQTYVNRKYICLYILILYIPTGWRGPIGYFKLQVIFRKRATKDRALWQKITNIDKASYGSSPPCSTYNCKYSSQGEAFDEISCANLMEGVEILVNIYVHTNMYMYMYIYIFIYMN